MPETSALCAFLTCVKVQLFLSQSSRGSRESTHSQIHIRGFAESLYILRSTTYYYLLLVPGRLPT